MQNSKDDTTLMTTYGSFSLHDMYTRHNMHSFQDLIYSNTPALWAGAEFRAFYG